MYTLVRKDDEEPLLLRNTKTSRSSRVGIFLFVFLLVGALGSALIYKQQSAPMTDVAVGDESDPLPKLDEDYECSDPTITAENYQTKIKAYNDALKTDSINTRTRDLRKLFQCVIGMWSKDTWSGKAVKGEDGTFKVPLCTHSFVHNYEIEDWFKLARDDWIRGFRAYPAPRWKNFKDKKMIMCPKETPICNEEKKCEGLGDNKNAAMVIDIGSSANRVNLMLYNDKTFPMITTLKWPTMYDGCQFIPEKNKDSCLADFDEYKSRTKKAVESVFGTVEAMGLKLNFVFGGVTAGGRNQADTGKGGELHRKLDALKEDIKKRAADPKLRVIIRMVSGHEEAYYAWIDANKDKIMTAAKDQKKPKLEEFVNIFERGGASAQFALTLKEDVNAYEDVYQLNLFGRDYFIWAYSLVAGGENQLWDAFDLSVKGQDELRKKAQGASRKAGAKVENPPKYKELVLKKDDQSFDKFLKQVNDFFMAQKGLCGDVGLKEIPCNAIKVELADGGYGDCTKTAGESLELGVHDRIKVEMQQRWTGLCVAGVKIPEFGIASLPIEEGTTKKPIVKKLTWTSVKEETFQSILPDLATAKIMITKKGKTKPNCEPTSPMTHATLVDYLPVTTGSKKDAEKYDDLLEYYNNCVSGKNKAFFVKLFYAKLFKTIEMGIKAHEFKTGSAATPSTPFKDATFTYETRKEDDKNTIEWLEGAAWLQIYSYHIANNEFKDSLASGVVAPLPDVTPGGRRTLANAFTLQN